MLSRISVRKPYTVLVGIVLAIVLGVVSFTNMTADLLPSINLPYAIVITTYPGASPEEVEMVVTKPVESSMATISNISNIRSTSSQNMSLVICEYEQTANMDSVTIEMRESLDQIRSYWPEEVGNSIIMKLNPDMLPIMVASIGQTGLDSAQLTEFVKNSITPEIESIEGVASVSANGEVEETIHIIIEQDKIDAVNVQIRDALDKSFAEAQDKLEKAQEELIQGREQFEEGKLSTNEQLSSAKSKLNDNQLEMLKGELEIEKQLKELEAKEADLIAGEQELTSKEQELLTGEQELIRKEHELELAKQQLNEVKQGLEKLNSSKSELELAMEDASLRISEIETMGDQAPHELKTQLETLKQQVSALQEQLIQIEQQIAVIDMTPEEVERKLLEVYAGFLEIENAKTEIAAGKESLNSTKTELLAGKEQISQGKAALISAKNDIQSGKSTVNEALEELSKNEFLAAIEMSSAAYKIDSGEKELEKSLASFEETKETAYEKANLENIITSDMIKGILAAQNFTMPAGYVTEEGVEYLIRVGDKIRDLDNLNNLILMDMKIEGVEPVKLSDVAQVATMDNSGEIYSVINGTPGLILQIQKQTGYSTGEVSDRINEKFEQLMVRYEGLNILPLMDQGIYIDLVVNSVVQNMIFGGILAIFILFLFLKDIKPTFVVACSIPISIMTAVALMYFSGITLNVISLSGLALGVGMLVDNSIVVIENIYRLRNEGLSAKKAAVEGAKQVSGAIIASTLTTVCVFLPIVFTEGITRQLFVDMGLTIGYSLLASLVIALTLVPMMGAGLLRNTTEKQNKTFDRIAMLYSKLLKRTLRIKPVVILVTIIMLVLSIVGAISNGTSFMPPMESTQVSISLETEKGTPLDETANISNEVITRIMEIEDVEAVGAMAGGGTRSMLGMGGGSSTNSVSMFLVLKEDKKLSGLELEELILDKTKDLKAEIIVETNSMDMSAMGGSGIQVQIKGKELDKLQEIAVDIADIVTNVDGTVNVSDGMEETTPELRVIVNKEKASAYNLTVAQVFQELNKKLRETTSATTIATATKDYDVFVKSQEDETLTREDLEAVTITVKEMDGSEDEILLSEIAEFIDAKSPASIHRTSQQRYITVSAEVDKKYNIGLVGNEIEKLVNQYELPEGYSFTMSGENESTNEALEQVSLMLLLAVIFMYLIMVAQFQSLLSPFIIMFTLPLAFTGGFLGLFLTGNEVSVIAMIGFVMLSGIIVNNGIVLVDYINQLRRAGMDKKEAIVEAGRTRLRPIIMTAFTTILGLSTLAIGFGMGADMIQPMAIVAIGGLIYGTLLTLFLVPCIYDIFHRSKSMVEEEI
ncbi:efflux RND transporter permease subunit [Mobilitalea sibirica]|uniref:Efflux RND transporter permease subunit n=1 Tax=Mobilitalea sibirica TaxID=1462919 RepID=A0A8J7H4Q9_9FIRM|nr:efflux RND transporter permease subunit [Mobilitalea sibirica]MBH1939616.1 efflux RND transporter permease subunit [Mobilitalea sibirica]